MKNRVLAMALTVAIFAAIAVCFLRPDDLNPDFGYVMEVRPLSENQSIIEVGGDVGCFESIDSFGVSFVSPDVAGVRIQPVKDNYVVLDLSHAGDADAPGGYIERLEDGNWVHYNDVGAYSNTGFRYSEISDYALPRCAAGMQNCQIYCPIFGKSGTYRITLFFRTLTVSDTPGESRMQLDEETHSVYFVVQIPDEMKKPFDVVSAYTSMRSSYFPSVCLALRANGGRPLPYVDRRSCKLERVVDNRAETVLPSTEREFAVVSSTNGFVPKAHGNVGVYGLLELNYPKEQFDADGLYILTLVFCENSDGSGERYTLTLNLRFDE